MIFSGEKDETDARMLADDKRKVFRRGAVDGFLLAVRQSVYHFTLNLASSFIKLLNKIFVY